MFQSLLETKPEPKAESKAEPKAEPKAESTPKRLKLDTKKPAESNTVVVDLTEERDPPASQKSSNRKFVLPAQKSLKRSEPSTSGIQDAKEKSSLFLKTFEEKGSQLVATLAEQFIECFEKQNEVLKQSFEAQSNMLLKHLPRIMSEQFTNAVIHLNSVAEAEPEVPENDDEKLKTELLQNLDDDAEVKEEDDDMGTHETGQDHEKEEDDGFLYDYLDESLF